MRGLPFVRYRNKFYLKREQFLASFSPRRALRVLMSCNKPDWQEDIQRGFSRTRHKVEFGSITAESLVGFDLVVPLTLADLSQVRRCSPLLERNPIPVPSEECVRLCHDKYEFNQALIKAGFGKHVPRMGIGPGFEPPYILKKRTGEWGKDCHIIRDRESEKAFQDLLTDSRYFCQEIVPGRFEFATHILFANDRIVKALNIMHEFESEAPIKGQDRDLYKMVHRCEYLDLFAAVLRGIGFQGLCCVNYKVADGQPFILEINPRFGGSLGPYLFSFLRHLG